MSDFDELKPWRHAVETKDYPHARAHRSTFGRKIIDTFETFSGFPIGDSKSFHFGVFDWFTLGIPVALLYLNKEFFNKARNKFTIGLSIAGFALISAPLMLARLAFAAVMTIASFPFIGIAHLIASSIGKKYKNKIKSHELSEAPADNLGHKPTVGRILQTLGLGLNDITRIDNTDIQNNTRQLKLYSKKYDRPVTEFKLNLHDDQQKKIYTALRKLNVGKIQTVIEEQTAPPALR